MEIGQIVILSLRLARFDSLMVHQNFMKCKYDGCNNRRSVDGRSCKPCSLSVHKYGINCVERDEILRSQGGKCLICDDGIKFLSDYNNMKSAVVDHDHGTKKIRGILCRSCNILVGRVERISEETRNKILNYCTRSL